MPQPPRPSDRVIARVRARLRARIDEMGIPIARLARRSGVNKVTIHRLIGDGPTRDIYLGTLANLADALLIELGDLLKPLPGESAGPSGSVMEAAEQAGDAEK